MLALKFFVSLMKSTLVDLHHRYPWCTKQRQRIPAHLRSQEDQVRNNLYQSVAALSFILEAYTYELSTDTQCHARQKGNTQEGNKLPDKVEARLW